MNATGGIISYYLSGSTNYKVHTFTTDGTLFVNDNSGSIDILVVGGGAGGGMATHPLYGAGSGGDGGDVILQLSQSVSVGAYNVMVGQGGLGQVYSSGHHRVPATNGGDSSFTGPNLFLYCNGGNTFRIDGENFKEGKSGLGLIMEQQYGGGGGSSIVNGQDADLVRGPGSGSDGLYSDINGTMECYGSGGGGGSVQYFNVMPGAVGGNGAGNGGDETYGPTSGSFFGCGGGGMGGFKATSGTGYQGVVIVRYSV